MRAAEFMVLTTYLITPCENQKGRPVAYLIIEKILWEVESKGKERKE